MIKTSELKYLNRCIELAAEALETGDRPFGSILVAANGRVLMEERNRTNSVDATRHPEFEIARWAAANLSAEERATATVYTSGEHCPMCAAAHGLAGLGRIVYASSSQQLSNWLKDLDAASSPVQTHAINEIAPNVMVEGPVDALAQQIQDLHRRFYQQ